MVDKNVIPHAAKQGLRNSYWVWAVLLAVVIFTAAVRIRLLEVPLERDEGEYAYAGQLILQGIAPYTQAYNMKLPGIYAAYALILAVFGQTHGGIHLGLLVVNTVTILLLFLLGKRLFGPVTGVGAAAAFALLSLGQAVQGIFANAEHFVILTALGGILFLLYAIDYQKWWSLLAGAILLGVAFIMKQHGAAFIVFAGLYLLFCELCRRPMLWRSFSAKGILFLLGVLLPFVVTCLVFWWCGGFEKFWFWTFVYAKEYVSRLQFSSGIKYLKMQITQIIGPAILIWILAGFGLISWWWNREARRHSVFVVGFLLFSFLSVCPGFYFRPHYFILLLPAVALLAGIGAGSGLDLFARTRSLLLTRAVPILLGLAILFYTVYKQRNFLFFMTPTEASRTTYGLNPFPESLEIAQFIEENSSEDDCIAVIGSEPQIYFYSNRHSATGYIYTYALMGNHRYALKMQEEMISEIESNRPKFLIFVNVSASWLVRPGSERRIFQWFQQYRQNQHMRPVGFIDIVSMKQTVYRWSDEALDYSPLSKCWISVWGRDD